MSIEIDPVRYEVFQHRLFNILEEGRIAISTISGSPIVVEGGETVCSFHLADGRPILVAAGILLHAYGARDFVINCIELYEKDPGINDGDQFFFNDPYIGGQHTADMVMIKPVFHKGKRIAWAGSVMHTPETGAASPAAADGAATNIYQEGIRILGLKVIEGGKFRPDVFNTLVRQTRDPALVGMDINARIAANNVCTARYLELIERFGLDFVEAAAHKIVADSEKMARAKLRGLPDGVWRSRVYNDNTGVRERPFKVVCTMTKEGDEICFDFSGSSPQNEGSVNSTLPAAWGSLFVVLCSQLFWDVPWSEGMAAPVKLIAPEGTVVNCRYPAAVSVGVGTTGCMIQETAHECVAKMLFAGGIIEDVNSAWRGTNGACPYFEGINQYGAHFVGVTLDTFATGIGAMPYRDGVDSGGNMMNPQSSIADEEITEMSFPLLCLGRSNATDSGGFGRFCGGMGPQTIHMVYGTQQLAMGLAGGARRTPSNWGMFGGYPNAVQEARFALDSDLAKWLEKSQIPGTFEEVKSLGGRIIDPPNCFPVIPVKHGDVVIYRLAGGGGFGDPLDREPERVAEHVGNYAISLAVARKVYGVIIDPHTLQVDKEATKTARKEIRKQRLKNAIPVSTWRAKSSPNGKQTKY